MAPAPHEGMGAVLDRGAGPCDSHASLIGPAMRLRSTPPNDDGPPRARGPATLRLAAASCLVAATFLSPVGCEAAKLTWSHDALGRPYVLLQEDIREGDAGRIMLALSHAKDRRLPYIRVDSPGGSTWEGIRLGKLVRDRGIAVALGVGRCASACFSLVAAARERFASPAATLAVHRASIDHGETPVADQSTLDVVTVYRRWGVPLDVIGGMAATASGEVFKLTPDMKDRVATATADGLPPASWHASKAVRGRAPTDEEVEAEFDKVRPTGDAEPRRWSPSAAAMARAAPRGFADTLASLLGGG